MDVHILSRHQYVGPPEIIGCFSSLKRALDGRRGYWWLDGDTWTTAAQGEYGSSRWINPKGGPRSTFRRYFYTVQTVPLT